jgi:hypothetical protein
MATLRQAHGLLVAGDWQAAHVIVQDDPSPLASWAHAIVHLMEGDRANAAYWYRRAGRPEAAPDAIAAEISALGATLDEGDHG